MVEIRECKYCKKLAAPRRGRPVCKTCSKERKSQRYINRPHRGALTQEKLKAHMHYCPDTGVFTWTNPTSSNISVGSRADILRNTGYMTVRICYNEYQAHRLAFLYMVGSFPENVVDHIDGDRKNNTWVNLRPATLSENAANSRISARNTSGVKGVSFDRYSQRWCAYVSKDRVKVFCRKYLTFEEAVAARNAVHEVVYGEYSWDGVS